MILDMYIAPGQGLKTSWGQMLMSTESPYHFAHLLQVLKQSLKYDFKHILNDFIHVYIAPGQGQTPSWEQNFDVNRNSLSLCPYVASFKMIPSKSDFIHIFNDFIHVNSRKTLGDKLLMSTESPYHFDHLLQVSNKSL